MNFEHSERSRKLQGQVEDIFTNDILPRNREWHAHVKQYETTPPFLADLQRKARSQGLWNLALPDLAEDEPGTRLTNMEYAPLAEIMGRISWAPLVFNCQPPDVPNMIILQGNGTPKQKARWLTPLLEGKTRSAFGMTEPDVACSDATNIMTQIIRDGDEYVIKGRKWFTSGVTNPDCAFIIVMGSTDQEGGRTRRHSMVIVPPDTPGVRILRRMSIFGNTSAPIGEVQFTDVRVPADHLLGEEGMGFRVGQERLGPARVHHCMRAIGNCEVLISLMRARANERVTFGRPIIEYDTVQNWIALSRIELEQARLLIYKTAWLLDNQDHRSARREVSLIKVAVVRMHQKIADRAIQVFGAMGMTDDTPIASSFVSARGLRIGDGPDEVHLRQIFRLEPTPQYTIAESPYMFPFDPDGDDVST